MINDEIHSDKKLIAINNYVKKNTGNKMMCKICRIGFDINKNTPTSCRTHLNSHTITGLNKYGCCNKEEPCRVGYHIPCDKYINSLVQEIKYKV